ncbi:hypothetical protein BGHDH14_bgh06438 [Blumeria hordei DH14]|uniref:Uncharacterized protein n=1 Tax=Blumeria graminis f. sp. hordei (strain DH14) TaxID=546991 RepID=N1J6M8_BLUG1|nr:hypothetical protein BGHDH14_bgh06438 [Blumeria hordei DH14]
MQSCSFNLVRREKSFQAALRTITSLPQNLSHKILLNKPTSRNSYAKYHTNPTLNYKDKNEELTNTFNCHDISLKASWRRGDTYGHRYWAGDILTDYLNISDTTLRQKFWNNIRSKNCGKFLPTILVHFFHISNTEGSLRTSLDHEITRIALSTLESKNLCWEDVQNWAYILSTQHADEMAKRIYESDRQLQEFLIMHVMNSNLSSARSLDMLFSCVWDLILGKRSSRKTSSLLSNKIMQCPRQNECDFLSPGRIKHDGTHQESPATYIDRFTFVDLARRLLRQSRRLWPASMTNVAHMASSYSKILVAKANCNSQSLNSHLSRQLCNILNILMVELSYQATVEPYNQVVHNWNAQKILLKLATEFRPALILSHSSYRAIVQVLAAREMTPNEKDCALRRSPNWPPWIVAKHGMDASFSTDEDSSRVVAGIYRMNEAGYSGGWLDDALRIIGGQDFDGTPTIQQRRILPWPVSDHGKSDEFNPNVWAARIMATRNIQEAWTAFVEFKKRGGKPSQDTYLALFEKLTYQLVVGGRNREYNPIPGDGREVLPIPDNNFSEYYKRNLEPPSIQRLYSEMLQSGQRPAGRCLKFLVRNSRTPDEGFRYLIDGGLSIDILESFRVFSESPHLNNTPKIPKSILVEFLYLICRFVPRAIRDPRQADTREKNSRWIVKKLVSRSSYGISLNQPLRLAAYILSTQRPKTQLPWYILFRALSRENIIVSLDVNDSSRNDILAWKLFRASLADFENCGLQLNARGFSMLCHGIQKYSRAVARTKNENETIDLMEAHLLIKSEFKRLSKSSQYQENFQKLYEPIRGIHLHAYIRCLALAKDYEEIVTTVQWMSNHAKELNEILQQESKGAQVRFRRVFLAIHTCCKGTRFEPHLKALISSVDSWEGWPTDEEVDVYKKKSHLEGHICW